MTDRQAEELQRFRPTNGRFTGVLGLLLCGGVGAAFVLYESPRGAVIGVISCAFVAVLMWMALLRPSVSATDTELRLRTLVEDVSIPLASIDTVVVRRYLLVRSGGRKYICPAISRSLRKTVRTEMKWRGGASPLSIGPSPERLGGLQTEVQDQYELAYPDFVEQRITHLAANDRARRGIEERSEEEYELGSQVVRRTAWLELGALAFLAVAFVVVVVL